MPTGKAGARGHVFGGLRSSIRSGGSKPYRAGSYRLTRQSPGLSGCARHALEPPLVVCIGRKYGFQRGGGSGVRRSVALKLLPLGATGRRSLAVAPRHQPGGGVLVAAWITRHGRSRCRWLGLFASRGVTEGRDRQARRASARSTWPAGVHASRDARLASGAVIDDLFRVEFAGGHQLVMPFLDYLELVVLNLQFEQRNLVAGDELRRDGAAP